MPTRRMVVFMQGAMDNSRQRGQLKDHHIQQGIMKPLLGKPARRRALNHKSRMDTNGRCTLFRLRNTSHSPPPPPPKS